MLPQLVSWTETAYSQLTAKLDYHPLAPKWQKTQLPITINGKTVKIDYWYPLPLKPKDKISVFFYASESDFWRTKTTFYPPIGAGAFAEQLHWRIVMPIIQDSEMMFRLITHELAHIFQFGCWYKGRLDLIEATVKSWTEAVWYFEGYSQHLSGLHLVRPTDIYLTRLVVLKDFIPAVKTWKQISNYLINYNLAPHFFDWIAEKYGQETVKRIFKEIGIIGPTDRALKKIIHQILQKSFGQIDLEFRDYLRNKYKHLHLKNEAHAYGTNLHLVEEIQSQSLIKSMSGSRAMRQRLAKKKRVKFLYEPVVSPDGKKI